jgi:carbon-monoxide dehydrogenase medium subunit
LKLSNVDYACPTDFDTAVDLIADSSRDIRILAGGQSLLAALNFRLGEPDLLVDINRIPELSGIKHDNGTIRIGATTRHAQVMQSEVISEHLPLVARAIQEVAHPAIRNRGTFGGSVALADPAAEMPACLLACGGTIIIGSREGERAVNADDFFLGLYETALQPGEMIRRIDIPSHAGSDHHFAFAEFARRHGDYANAGVAATWQGMDKVSNARIVLFGVSDKPVRSATAESIMNGQPLNEQTAGAVADMATEAISVFGDVSTSEAMKRHLARVMLKRALMEVLES